MKIRVYYFSTEKEAAEQEVGSGFSNCNEYTVPLINLVPTEVFNLLSYLDLLGAFDNGDYNSVFCENTFIAMVDIAVSSYVNQGGEPLSNNKKIVYATKLFDNANKQNL